MIYKKSITLSLIFFFTTFFSKSQTQNFQWAEHFGGIGEEYGFGIVVDDSSNSYTTGYVDASNNFRQHRSSLCVDHDIFIAKHDRYGSALWIKQFGGSGDDIGWAITTDKNHNVYVTGSFQDTLFLSTGDLISTDYNDIFIAKFNSDGDLLWAKKSGGSLVNNSYSIATDSQNNIYITGSFNGTTQFETTSIISRGANDAFLAKYDTDGYLQWAINEGGSTGTDDAFALSIDKNDNIFVCGKFTDTAYFSADTIFSKGNSDFFIAKHTTSGNLLWVRSAGGISNDVAQGITCDKEGNSYITGYFTGTAFFGMASIVASGSSDIFIAKYDPMGNMKWVKSAGGNGDDQGSGITTGANGKIYATGFFNNNAIFGSYSLSSNGYADIFVTCVDSTGNYSWTTNCGGADNDAGSSIKTDTSGNVFFTGTFSSLSSFGAIPLNSFGDKDFFIAKIATEINLAVDQSNLHKNELIVYPNPSNGSITFSLNENQFFKPIEISISDELGQQVYSKEHNSSENTIDLRGLTKGIYFLKTTIDNTLFCKKIILN